MHSANLGRFRNLHYEIWIGRRMPESKFCVTDLSGVSVKCRRKCTKTAESAVEEFWRPLMKERTRLNASTSDRLSLKKLFILHPN